MYVPHMSFLRIRWQLPTRVQITRENDKRPRNRSWAPFYIALVSSSKLLLKSCEDRCQCCVPEKKKRRHTRILCYCLVQWTRAERRRVGEGSERYFVEFVSPLLFSTFFLSPDASRQKRVDSNVFFWKAEKKSNKNGGTRCSSRHWRAKWVMSGPVATLHKSLFCFFVCRYLCNILEACLGMPCS